MQRRLTPIQQEQVISLYESGKTQAFIANELEIPQPAISQFLRDKTQSRKKHLKNRTEPMRGPKPGYRTEGSKEALYMMNPDAGKYQCPSCACSHSDENYRLKMGKLKTKLKFCTRRCWDYYTSETREYLI